MQPPNPTIYFGIEEQKRLQQHQQIIEEVEQYERQRLETQNQLYKV